MKARSQAELTDKEREEAIKAFEGLGLCTQLAEAAAGLGWKKPTIIQEQAVPPLIQGGLSLQPAYMVSDVEAKGTCWQQPQLRHPLCCVCHWLGAVWLSGLTGWPYVQQHHRRTA